MKRININFTDDPNYRYKMPVMEVRSQGRGNGAQFVIENLKDVAFALHRSPEEITKFFQLGFGNFGRYNPSEGSVTFTGSATIAEASRVLKDYVFTHVLCQACSNPETSYILKEKGLSMVCAACGQARPLAADRFTRYVIKIIEQKTRAEQGKTGASDRPEASRVRSPVILYPRIKKIMRYDITPSAKAGELQEIADEAVKSRILREDEIVFFYMAALFDTDRPALNYIKECIPVLREILTKDDGLSLLHSLDCITRKYEEEMLSSKTNLLSAILLELYGSELIDKNAVNAWITDVTIPVVPVEYHERVVETAGPFLEWLEKQGDEEYDEEEYEEESD